MKRQKCFFYLNVLFFIFSICILVVIYYFIKSNIKNPIFSGLGIAVVSTITSYLQRVGTGYLIQKSNIKYIKSRNTLYMFSISFYRLINVNLPVIYYVLWPSDTDTKS
jgi:cbb3-type cytochrome oxidase subunit 1